jgi:hypothetical protein
MNPSTKAEARLFKAEEEELIIVSRAVTSGVSYFRR